ncbi:MAG: Gfo/Idh/MocA family oxidoreductase [Armatimonadetes bacterium]|nr:Gfo/Idh/MocA family oxidoreductase [Armatimonadota bacterium]MDE2207723.1 Gfo/Idh/MocA family oxidoreductase [Armatimonadota bacterium]
MTATYRVGAAGLSHDHVWGELNHWKAAGNVVLAAAADPDPALLEQFQAAFSDARVYRDYHEMLEKEELQFVQAAAGNSEGANIVEAAAARGLHVVSEKPMAATLDQATRMRNAAARAGTLLLVNWPTAWSAAWQELERRVLAGDIGEPRHTRYRSAHSGPIDIGCSPQFVHNLITPEINGAGALMDYCCYGADLAARLLGRPMAVTGMRGWFGDEQAYAASDDSAVIVAQYAHAFGVCEASWCQPVETIEANPLVYGSEGAIGVVRGELVVSHRGKQRETVLPLPTEAPRRSAAEYIIYLAENRAAAEGFCSPEVSLVAQEILELGLRAANTGLRQPLS